MEHSESIKQAMKMERLCIYPKDIQIVTGRSERYGRKLIKKIKEAFSKQNHQLVTIEEFCTYTGLCTQSVMEKLKE
jgi:hypothetical protein